VITAAHCVDRRDLRRAALDVVVDDGDLCDANDGGRHRVEKVVLTSDNDVTVLQLETDVTAVVPSAPVGRGGRSTSFVSWGWGRNGAVGADPCLASATWLSPSEACGPDPDYLCLAPARPDLRRQCIGDSGSPTFAVTSTGRKELVALASATYGCGPEGAAIHALLREPSP
jgi:secreted trypsin-like serine protease